MHYNSYYNVMPDGTVKQVNPFTGVEVWAVPGRSRKPVTRQENSGETLPLEKYHIPEDYCAFCEARYYETSPEKSRLVCQDGNYMTLSNISPIEYFKTVAEFRRLPNLFEIVSLEYWKKNYGYFLPKELVERKEKFMSTVEGRELVQTIVRYKLSIQQGIEIEKIHPDEETIQHVSDAFFGGGHELITPRRHWCLSGAGEHLGLCSSGYLTRELHYWYIKFTIDAMLDILAHNHYIRYISIFQNWLASAGASFDHLHKQIVALDEWGQSIGQQIAMLRKEPNSFNDLGVNFAAMHNLIFAESEYALALVGIGHRFPTVEVYSKSAASRPYEHSDEEIRGVSDMLHAIHAALGNEISCNEEWYYTPVDAIYPMPWHVQIKLRINTPAGFEGGTGIFINPLTPLELRDRIVPNLFRLRQEEKIARFSIADECPARPNPLQYVQAYRFIR